MPNGNEPRTASDIADELGFPRPVNIETATAGDLASIIFGQDFVEVTGAPSPAGEFAAGFKEGVLTPLEIFLGEGEVGDSNHPLARTFGELGGIVVGFIPFIKGSQIAVRGLGLASPLLGTTFSKYPIVKRMLEGSMAFGAFEAGAGPPSEVEKRITKGLLIGAGAEAALVGAGVAHQRFKIARLRARVDPDALALQRQIHPGVFEENPKEMLKALAEIGNKEKQLELVAAEVAGFFEPEGRVLLKGLENPNRVATMILGARPGALTITRPGELYVVEQRPLNRLVKVLQERRPAQVKFAGEGPHVIDDISDAIRIIEANTEAELGVSVLLAKDLIAGKEGVHGRAIFQSAPLDEALRGATGVMQIRGDIGDIHKLETAIHEYMHHITARAAARLSRQRGGGPGFIPAGKVGKFGFGAAEPRFISPPGDVPFTNVFDIAQGAHLPTNTGEFLTLLFGEGIPKEILPDLSRVLKLKEEFTEATVELLTLFGNTRAQAVETVAGTPEYWTAPTELLSRMAELIFLNPQRAKEVAPTAFRLTSRLIQRESPKMRMLLSRGDRLNVDEWLNTQLQAIPEVRIERRRFADLLGTDPGRQAAEFRKTGYTTGMEVFVRGEPVEFVTLVGKDRALVRGLQTLDTEIVPLRDVSRRLFPDVIRRQEALNRAIDEVMASPPKWAGVLLFDEANNGARRAFVDLENYELIRGGEAGLQARVQSWLDQMGFKSTQGLERDATEVAARLGKSGFIVEDNGLYSLIVADRRSIVTNGEVVYEGLFGAPDAVLGSDFIPISFKNMAASLFREAGATERELPVLIARAEERFASKLMELIDPEVRAALESAKAAVKKAKTPVPPPFAPPKPAPVSDALGIEKPKTAEEIKKAAEEYTILDVENVETAATRANLRAEVRDGRVTIRDRESSVILANMRPGSFERTGPEFIAERYKVPGGKKTVPDGRTAPPGEDVLLARNPKGGDRPFRLTFVDRGIPRGHLSFKTLRDARSALAAMKGQLARSELPPTAPRGIVTPPAREALRHSPKAGRFAGELLDEGFSEPEVVARVLDVFPDESLTRIQEVVRSAASRRLRKWRMTVDPDFSPQSAAREYLSSAGPDAVGKELAEGQLHSGILKGGAGGGEPPMFQSQMGGHLPEETLKIGFLEKLTNAVGLTAPWMTGMERFAQAAEESGIGAMWTRVFQPTQRAIEEVHRFMGDVPRELLAGKTYNQQIRKIQSLAARVSRKRHDIIRGWVEAMSREEIEAAGGLLVRGMNNEEISIARQIADLGLGNDVPRLMGTLQLMKRLVSNKKQFLVRASSLERQQIPDEMRELIAKMRVLAESTPDDLNKLMTELGLSKEEKKVISILNANLGRNKDEFSIFAVSRWAGADPLARGYKNGRAQFAAEHSMSSRELELGDEMNRLFRAAFGDSGLDAKRQLGGYWPHMRMWAEQGFAPDAAFMRSLLPDDAINWSARRFRTGELNIYELDPVLTAYKHVRGLMMSKHFDPILPTVNAELRALRAAGRQDPVSSRVYDIMHEYTQNLLGRPHISFAKLNTAISTGLRALGHKAPDRFAETIINNLVALGYGATIPFRPALTLRNYFQMFQMIPPWIGFRDFFGGLETALTKEGYRQAVKAGAVPVGVVPLHAATEALGPMTLNRLSVPMRRLFEKGFDWYRKADDIGRAAAFHGMRRRAHRHLPDLMKGRITLDEFKRRSGIFRFSRVEQQEFETLFKSGRIEESIDMLGRLLSRKAHFRYGHVNHPAGWGSVYGRMFGQFGTWPVQYKDMLMEGLSRGTTVDRFQFLASHLAINFSLVAAGTAVGLNLWNWVSFPSLNYTGGPFADMSIDAVRALNGSPAERAMARRSLFMQFPTFEDPRSVFVPGSYLLGDIWDAMGVEGTGGSVMEAAGFRVVEPNERAPLEWILEDLF